MRLGSANDSVIGSSAFPERGGWLPEMDKLPLTSLAQLIKDALLAFSPPGHAPATTWIGVRSLANKDFLIEIEVIGVID